MDCTQITHPSFTYALMHMSVGGGIAVAFIAIGVAATIWAFFTGLSKI